MEKACYGRHRGPQVTPQEFHERASSDYKRKGISPYCPQCGEEVDLYGINNWRISRFDHQDRPEGWDPLDDCPLSNRHDGRFAGLQPDGWDYDRGDRLRKEFHQDDNLRLAYAFALRLTKSKNLPVSKWKSLIRRADKKNIWSYADIPLWIIPYILLTLENFVQEAGAERSGFEFHFVFEKPRNTTASVLWNPVVATSLKRVFTNSGTTIFAPDNPFKLSEEKMREKAGDTNWINEDLLRKLRG